MGHGELKRLMAVSLLALDTAMMIVAMWLAAYLRFGKPYPEVAFIERSSEAFYHGGWE